MFSDFNPQSIIATLTHYYEIIDNDMKCSNNHTCKKGCCKCCAADFEISITEFFMILNHLKVNFGDEYLKKVCTKAKQAKPSGQCIFVDESTGACSIYEVRPLVCRKYGLYRVNTSADCKLLDPEEELLPNEKYPNTTENTIYFTLPGLKKKIQLLPKRIDYWFSSKTTDAKTMMLFRSAFQDNAADFVGKLYPSGK